MKAAGYPRAEQSILSDQALALRALQPEELEEEMDERDEEEEEAEAL